MSSWKVAFIYDITVTIGQRDQDALLTYTTPELSMNSVLYRYTVHPIYALSYYSKIVPK